MEENFLTSIKNRSERLLNYKEDLGAGNQGGNRRDKLNDYRYGDL